MIRQLTPDEAKVLRAALEIRRRATWRETNMTMPTTVEEKMLATKGKQYVPTLTPADVVEAGYAYDEDRDVVTLADDMACTRDLLVQVAGGWHECDHSDFYYADETPVDPHTHDHRPTFAGIPVVLDAGMARDTVEIRSEAHDLVEGTIGAIHGALPGECG